MSTEWSPCWCNDCCAGNLCCAWLCLAERRGVRLPVTGDLLCWGFAFPSARAWVDSWGLHCLCFYRSLVFRVPQKWTEDLEESTCFFWNSWVFEICRLPWNHEVTEEPRIGDPAVRGHLHLCLSQDDCHWHPTGGWVRNYKTAKQCRVHVCS